MTKKVAIPIMIPEKFKSINTKVILFKTIYIKAGSEFQNLL